MIKKNYMSLGGASYFMFIRTRLGKKMKRRSKKTRRPPTFLYRHYYDTGKYKEITFKSKKEAMAYAEALKKLIK